MASPEPRQRPGLLSRPEQPPGVWIITVYEADTSGASEALLAVLNPAGSPTGAGEGQSAADEEAGDAA